MINLLSFSLCLLAFNGFAMAKNGHFKAIFNKRLDDVKRKQFLVLAWISILLSFSVCIFTQSGYGALQFFGFAGLSVLLVMTFNNFFVKLAKPFLIINFILLVISALYLALTLY